MSTIIQAVSELIRANEAAQLCNMGRSTFDRHLAAGKIPAPIRVGATPMWGRRELLAWIDHGCPDRAAWTAIWNRLRSKNQPR